jgi:hypothetical protein
MVVPLPASSMVRPEIAPRSLGTWELHRRETSAPTGPAPAMTPDRNDSTGPRLPAASQPVVGPDHRTRTGCGTFARTGGRGGGGRGGTAPWPPSRLKFGSNFSFGFP